VQFAEESATQRVGEQSLVRVLLAVVIGGGGGRSRWKVLTKDPTTPHMRRYTTSCNIDVRK